MIIATWNINSLRLRLDLLEKFCHESMPDVICLQETKVQDQFFPVEAIKALGYNHMVYAGEKSYNGVAILSKYEITDSFSLTFYNDHKRHICAKIQDFELHNFYIPAGGDEPNIETNIKFKHKLTYIELMKFWFATNRVKEDKIILVGDLNIAPHEHDVWSSKQLKNVVSHTPIERSALIDLQNSFDFIDSARKFIPFDQKLYTWWSYRNLDWKKANRGRRLDHIWVSYPLASRLQTINCLKDAREWVRPSDHVPYMIDIAPMS